ncbi:hypothetical protein GUJ93_ZPchr0012g21137 [Zizania palustris]|uniref:Proline-rich protein n=1 Tax=Zizania palustris TaxID=103762 RepID=A0A8J5WXK4_ZIZPA|nr:hypothetical protein GUJ93_ZPchr0012g21137 [Zizania palustris]
MGALLLGLYAVLLANVLVEARVVETAASMAVVGLAKCADCNRKNMKAELAFKGLRVAIKCNNGNGQYETKATSELGKSGKFSVPLAADLLREDGELRQDCFAQLRSASNRPCPGQEPSWIVNDAEKNTFVAVAGKTHYPSAECASAFLCDFFHKKHHYYQKKHHFFHKEPSPVYTNPTTTPVYTYPTYKPPTPVYTHPTPVYTYPTPVPSYKPPTPVYSNPVPSTPIYHPPAEKQKVQDPETDPEMLKKLLPFIKKKPFFFPKYPKFPPLKEEVTKP